MFQVCSQKDLHAFFFSSWVEPSMKHFHLLFSQMFYVDPKDTIQHHARWEIFVSLEENFPSRRDSHWLTDSCSIANEHPFNRNINYRFIMIPNVIYLMLCRSETMTRIEMNQVQIFLLIILIFETLIEKIFSRKQLHLT